MRVAFLICSFVLANLTRANQLDLEVSHSKPMSFLYFLDAGFKEPFTSRALQELIDKSDIPSFSNPEFQNTFDVFKTYLQKGYNFQDESPNRPEGFWANDAVMMLASNSSSLASFEMGLSAFLPFRGLTQFQRLREEFLPHFERVMWSKSEVPRAKEIANLKAKLETTNFVSWLERAKTFYKSSYPNELPFLVSLIPIPDQGLKNHHSSATSLRNVQVVPYFQSRGASDELEVVFHEFCHALYEAQDASVKMDIDQFFINKKDTHALYVYRYLNEALATALGNGLYSSIFRGGENPGDWYTEQNINKLAKAFYPLIKEKVSQNQPMDHSFFEQILELAKTQFPDAPKKLDANMFNVDFLFAFDDASKEPFDTNRIASAFRKKFRIQSLQKNRISPNDEVDLRHLGLANPILVTSSTSPEDIRFQGVTFEGLRDRVRGLHQFVAIVPQRGHYFFWLNAQSYEGFQNLLTALEKVPVLPDSETVITL